MLEHPEIPERLRRVRRLLTRIISRKKALMLYGTAYKVPPRALPLDLTETRPIEAAFNRNIRAFLPGGSASCFCE